MYESFYGLKKKPFSMSPDPGFLYLSKKHQKALTLFEYGLMNRAGFCVISGEIGSGKTTLIRKLFENMDSSIKVGMITNTHKGFGELLDWVLSAFDIHDKEMNSVEKHQRFIDFLLEQYAARKTTLLIVDEAQNMAADKLEELRLLSNVNSDKDQIFQVILAGQTGLRETLALPELEQLVQRISVDYHLDALDEEDTRGYIAHRLSVAGAETAIFTDDASNLIFKYSGGIPRLINLLCDTALVYGFADQQPVVGENLVSEMIKERMQNSLVPLASTDQPVVAPPKKHVESKPLAEKPVVQKTDLSAPGVDEETPVDEPDFSEKVLLANDVESKIDTNKDSEAEEEIQYCNILNSEQEAVSSELEEVGHAVDSIEFLQPDKSKKSHLLKPMLVALFVLLIVTTFYITSLDGDKSKSETPTAETNKYKKAPESINREELEVTKVISDEIQQQLDESRKFQQEMMARQQENRDRMESLEEQSAVLKSERDKALINAKAEKEKRRVDKKAAQIAAKREQEAEKMAQEAIAEAMAAKRKAELLEELRIKEKVANEEALAEQQKKLDEAVEVVEAVKAAEAAEAVKAAEEENFEVRKKSEDARCQGVTARFLSVCR